MKSLRVLFTGRLLGIAFVATAFGLTAEMELAAQETFEGRVKMSMTDGETEQEIDYYVKGDRMRVVAEDPRGESGVMIMDLEKKELLMLMPDQKAYMTMPVPDLQNSGNDDEQKPEPTGETREILGYTAEKYVMENNGTEFEIWATDELGPFVGLQLPGEQPGEASAADRALAKENFFPLLIIESRNGSEESRVEVTEIEKQSLQNTLFQPPEDFRKMEIPFQAPQ